VSVVPARIPLPLPAWGADGLVPAIVQDESDGRVLMLAWLDAEALAATLETGEVHFHSRSRGRLWRKGETSGNVLRLLGLSLDCDADAILLAVEPAGPTCHRGTRSCFDPSGPSVTGPGPAHAPHAQGFSWLERLWATIDARATHRPDGSYTAALVHAGVDAAARKVTEEATEVLIAAKDDAAAERRAGSPADVGEGSAGDGGEAAATLGDRTATRDRLTDEMADLLFHALVLLRERGLEPAVVIDRLRERHRA
jgi:phosphoribosyl-AMP cyclohydrolase / phosphoribosyl-ATP pyrophosphohydrolase